MASIGRKSVVACCLWLLLGCPLPAHADEEAFGGVGLQVVPIATGELVVLGVLPDSPAQKSGIAPGDLILKVDGHLLAGSEFTEIISVYLWGKVGSSLVLEFLRPGKAGSQSATLLRAPLKSGPPAPPGVRMLTPED